MYWYYLSLGSNMGDSLGYLNDATQEITEIAACVYQSCDYTTAPQGYTDQDYFVNRSLLVAIQKAPQDFLSIIQALEVKADRKRIVRWGPRTLDIDIIWAKGYSCHTERLIIPHPRAFERGFVVVPTLDLPMVDPIFKLILERSLPLVQEHEVRKI